MTPLIDRCSAEEIFRRWFGSWLEVLDYLDANGGRLQFVPEFWPYLKANGHDSYPLIYERWPQVIGAARSAIERFNPEEMVLPGAEISFITPEDRGAFAIQILEALDEIDPLVGPHLADEDRVNAREAASQLGSDTLDALAPFVNGLPSLMMAMVHEYLSVAVHGVPLSALVQRAKSGDDEAFGKAIQIDKRILSVIPYFVDRFAQANLEDNTKFQRMIANKMKSPAYKGRLQHKGIWLVLGLLDLFGLLQSMSGEELLDLCTEIGANDGATPIEDVKNMLKRVADYNRYQNSLAKSTP